MVLQNKTSLKFKSCMDELFHFYLYLLVSQNFSTNIKQTCYIPPLLNIDDDFCWLLSGTRFWYVTCGTGTCCIMCCRGEGCCCIIGCCGAFIIGGKWYCRGVAIVCLITCFTCDISETKSKSLYKKQLAQILDVFVLVVFN